MHEDWEKPLLMDIQIVDEEEQCSRISSSLNIEYVPIFKYTWPGLKPSCDCQNKNNKLEEELVFDQKCIPD